MIKLHFNPFGVNFDDLKTENLQKLYTVSEGWYIEYKSQAISTKNIGKSLAAFANHYGGWLFFGVVEAADGSHLAGGFPGLDFQEISNIIENLRNASRDIVSPAPYFEYKILSGPCQEIGLIDGRSILVVGIPVGASSPYIHNDGKIYRRVADSSEPKPETDRLILDNLWDRRRNAERRLTNFLEGTPILSESENNLSYLELFLLPDPLRLMNQQIKIKFEDFVEFMAKPEAHNLSSAIPFDNFFPMSGGFIARHIYQNDPYRLTLTWKYYRNGFNSISVPFPSATVETVTNAGWLNGYLFEKKYVRLLDRKSLESCQVLDLNQIVSAIMSIVCQTRSLLLLSDIKGPYFAKAVLHNVWRRIPFLDTEPFIEYLGKHGLPILQFEEEYIPSGRDADSLIQLDELGPVNEDEKSSLMIKDFANIIIPVFNSLGIPELALFKQSGDAKDEDISIFLTSDRANEVNRRRSQTHI